MACHAEMQHDCRAIDMGCNRLQAEKQSYIGHTCVNNVTISPNGSLCASGGKDGQAMLWENISIH